MKRKIQTAIASALLVLLAASGTAFSQSADLWPSPVDGLVEYSEIEFEIVDSEKAIWREKTLYHIYHDDQKFRGSRQMETGPYRKFRKLSITLLDMDNNVIRKSTKKDVQEAEFTPGYVLFSDNKYYWIEDMVQAALPYKVLVEIEMEYKSLFLWPGWWPQENIPVLKASYKLIRHSDIAYDVAATGLPETPQIRQSGNQTIHTWQVSNLEPRLSEDFSRPDDFEQIKLRFKANKFSIGGTIGYTNDWGDVARWYNRLAEGRYELPGEAIQRVKRLTEGIADDREKVAVLYRFLQDYTHYVAISLGIGGWQPHSAESVFRNKYGDCKDLSTLMVAMLDVADIQAYPALARTKQNGLVDPDFPASQFNHCITVVPFASDTLFIECTADYMAYNYPGVHLEGTHVLMVTEDGGQLIQVPQSSPAENCWTSKLSGNVTSTGLFKVTGHTTASGVYGDNFRKRLAGEPKDVIEERLADMLGDHVPRLDFESFETRNIEDNYEAPVKVSFSSSIANFATASGQRIFVNPNVLNRLTNAYIPDESVEDRQLPIYLPSTRRNIDSLTVKIPFGYKIEAAPKEQSLETPYGSYRTSYTFVKRELTYVREFELSRTQIDTSEYGGYLAFLKAVSKNDKSQFVFRR